MLRWVPARLLVVLLAATLLTAPTTLAQTTWYVDDNAPNDPGPGDPTVSDPLEDGSADHPFDAIQEGIDASLDGNTVLVLDGTYTGDSNKRLDFAGKEITLRSENGPESCVIDCEGVGRGLVFNDHEPPGAVVGGFTITGANGNYGGGVQCTNGSSPTIEGCIVRGNNANYGAGVNCGTDTSPTILNCVISGNTANNAGGGVRCSESNVVIVDSVISGNAAEDGGGIYCNVGGLTMLNCAINGNTAYTKGGSLLCQTSAAIITNCTIAGNIGSNGGGGAQVAVGSNVTIANSIFWGDTALEGPEIRVLGASNPSTLTVSYTDVDGGQAHVYVDSGCTLNWGDSNIDAEPRLVNGPYLEGGSPCIDAGTNDPPGGLPATDLEGDPRPQDGDGDVEPWTGQAETADMGADEFVIPTSPRICLTPISFEFCAPAGEAAPTDKNLSVWNCGIDTLEWQVVEDCPWLAVEPNIGSSTGEVDEVALSVDCAGLAPGAHVCMLDVVDPESDNTPVTVQVILYVGAIRHVPSEYSTIQDAIDAAGPLDMVLVADGTYIGAGNKDLDFRGKGITVRSEHGPASCIIDCEGDGRGFNFHNQELPVSVVDGFTITNGNATNGGGVHCWDRSHPTIRNCIISGNVASEGGGVRCNYSNPTIVNCIISHNTAGDHGGGLYCNESSPNIANCLISGNTANTTGGGLRCQTSTATIVNCTIVGNEGDSGGGAQIAISSDVTIANSIFSDNTALEGPEIHVLGAANPSTLTLLYTNIDGGQEKIYVHSACTLNWGDGNIDADPVFADPLAGDYHLLNGSSCVDAGTNEPPGGLPATDFEGDPRPQDGDGDVEPWSGQAETTDMGVDEVPPATSPVICSTPSEFDFSGFEGGLDPNDQTLSIWNCGIGHLNWAIVEDCPWLSVDPNSEQSTGEVDQVDLHVTTAGLTAGQYVCTFDVVDSQATNSPRTLSVTLHVARELRVPSGYPTIQAAIDDAIAGDEVAVADGTYIGTGNKNLDFGGKSITVRSENGPDDCIIDCENDGRGFYFHSGETPDAVVSGFTISNGYVDIDTAGGRFGAGVYCADYSSPTINGCLITANVATGQGSAHGGGGVGCREHSNPRITGCAIIGNDAPSGGGISCMVWSHPIVTNCTISQNSALSGGGVFCDDWSNPEFVDCMITGNFTTHEWGDGGGLYFFDGMPSLINCEITQNVGYTGGGIFVGWHCSPMIADCSLIGNTATCGGGAVRCEGSPTFLSCIISANEAQECAGGGIWFRGYQLTIIGCEVTGNTAHGPGGGVCCDGFQLLISKSIIADNVAVSSIGGGIGCDTERDLTIEDSTIARNRAAFGGGIGCEYGDAVITNCSFVANVGRDGAGVGCRYGEVLAANCTLAENHARRSGSGIACWGGHAVASNCLFSANTAAHSGGAVYASDSAIVEVYGCTLAANQALSGCALGCDSAEQQSPSSVVISNSISWNAADEIWNNDASTIVIEYSNVQGGWPGEGNIAGNPLFVSLDDGDYHLGLRSPCIDAGDNTAVPPDSADLDGDGDTEEPVPFDLDGNPRFFDDPATPDAGIGVMPPVDMGAYEFQVMRVSPDIRPGSCPNWLRLDGPEVLPMAVVGTADLDVTQIDPNSLVLRRADGVGGSTTPLVGSSGLKVRVEDVATPFEGEPCECHDLKGDGIDDLSMEFATREVVSELRLKELPGGTWVVWVELVVSGELLDGTRFGGADCVSIVPPVPGSEPPEPGSASEPPELAEVGDDGVDGPSTDQPVISDTGLSAGDSSQQNADADRRARSPASERDDADEDEDVRDASVVPIVGCGPVSPAFLLVTLAATRLLRRW